MSSSYGLPSIFYYTLDYFSCYEEDEGEFAVLRLLRSCFTTPLLFEPMFTPPYGLLSLCCLLAAKKDLARFKEAWLLLSFC